MAIKRFSARSNVSYHDWKVLLAYDNLKTVNLHSLLLMQEK